MQKPFLLVLILLYAIPIQSSYIKGDRVVKKHFHVVATCYNAYASQTDNTPLITADGSKINHKNPYGHRWIAISRDLKKQIEFGDSVFITDAGIYNGFWIVKDLLNYRYTSRIDFLVGKANVIDKWDSAVLYTF